ncbi:MAG: hypothetical protein JKX74_00970 [Flavobacteriales bacterium]|nr:hypothetical protein [Flavobacteriales bacterium]PCH88003.1 MAG: hypothetical protein COB88_04620 [Flavobacteriales bacterium]
MVQEAAREYHNVIILKIPEGYGVEGLEKLNVNVDNETGSFMSTAKLEGDQLLVSTKKVYKHHYEPKEKGRKCRNSWMQLLTYTNKKYA